MTKRGRRSPPQPMASIHSDDPFVSHGFLGPKWQRSVGKNGSDRMWLSFHWPSLVSISIWPHPAATLKSAKPINRSRQCNSALEHYHFGVGSGCEEICWTLFLRRIKPLGYPLPCLQFEGFQGRSFLPLVANVGMPAGWAHGMGHMDWLIHRICGKADAPRLLLELFRAHKRTYRAST
jgi:hypothetical protein